MMRRLRTALLLSLLIVCGILPARSPKAHALNGQISVLPNNCITAPSTSATSYHGPTNGVAAWDSNQDDPNGLFGGAGDWELHDWTVTLATAPDNGAGTQSYVFTLQVNNSDTALTVTISESATSATDSTNHVTIHPGDRWHIKCVPSGTPVSATREWWVFQCTAASGNLCPWSWTSSTSHTEVANTTYYFPPHCGGVNTVESTQEVPCPTDGTISNLYAQVETNPGNIANAMVVTLRKGATGGAALTDTTLTCTIQNNATSANDTTHSVSVTAGDMLDVKVVTAVGTTTTRIRFGMQFAPTVNGEQAFLQSNLAAPQNTTNYYYSQSGGSTTESQRANPLQAACTIKKLYIDMSGGVPANGQTVTYTLRTGANLGAMADTALVASFTGNGTSTQASDTTHNIAVSSTDFVSFKDVVGAGNTLIGGWGAVYAFAVNQIGDPSALLLRGVGFKPGDEHSTPLFKGAN